MKTLAWIAALSFASVPAWAGGTHGEHERVEPPPAAAAATAAAANSVRLTEGTVKKIDKDAGKLTITHGPLENLAMPGMTMVFQVKDAAFLEVHQGQKIRFAAEQVEGRFTVTVLEPQH